MESWIAAKGWIEEKHDTVTLETDLIHGDKKAFNCTDIFVLPETDSPDTQHDSPQESEAKSAVDELEQPLHEPPQMEQTVEQVRAVILVAVEETLTKEHEPWQPPLILD